MRHWAVSGSETELLSLLLLLLLFPFKICTSTQQEYCICRRDFKDKSSTPADGRWQNRPLGSKDKARA